MLGMMFKWSFINILRIISRDFLDVTPLSNLFYSLLIDLEWSYSEPIPCSRNQIGDYAFMSFSFIDLSELFVSMNFDTDSIFKDVPDLFPIFARLWAWPRHLDACSCFGEMSEDSLSKNIRFCKLVLNFYEILFFIKWHSSGGTKVSRSFCHTNILWRFSLNFIIFFTWMINIPCLAMRL